MEKTVLDVILVIYLVYALINLLMYLPRVRGWFGAIKPQVHLYNSKKGKLALIIPARNESQTIPVLFNSINKQTYAKEDFDIYVVVKEDDDPTIKLTEDMGGYCLVAKEQKCKGDALDVAFQYIIKNKNDYYDGLIVVDADCILDEHFLEEMNNSLASGKDVLQAKKNVKNYLTDSKGANSIYSSCNGLIWTLIDDMGNRYKSDIGVTNMTIGTGIMLTMKLVNELGGWPYRETVTEDMEFMYDCCVRKISTYYNSYCVMYVEESPSLSVTNKRRTRWLKGLIDSSKIYRDQIELLSGKENRKNRYYVMALWPVFRYIGSSVIFCLFNLIYGIVLLAMKNEFASRALMYSLLGFLVIYFSFFIMTLFCIICDHKNMKLNFIQRVVLLFVHPLFYMYYIKVAFLGFFTSVSDKWDETERIEFDEDLQEAKAKA